MDPFAHTFTGAALASTGLSRTVPLATAALVIGANAPDIDVLAWFGGRFAALEFRRGWTHGVLALAVLPFVVTGGLLLWDRQVRSRRLPDAQPARPTPLLVLSAVGVATHPSLDWLNNYGMRWLMPFDDTWTYGDALFIIDPWLWLMLGGAAFLAYSRSSRAIVAWSAFWLFASYLVLTNDLVSGFARGSWLAGLILLFAARHFLAPRIDEYIQRGTRVLLAVVTCYIAASLALNLPARADVLSQLASLGITPVGRVMLGPVPANPFRRMIVAETPAAYYLGQWSWLGRPRLQLEPRSIGRYPSDPVVAAVSRSPDVRRFLGWARFPYFEVHSDVSGYVVNVGDARYIGLGRGPVGVLTVRLNADFTLRPEE